MNAEFSTEAEEAFLKAARYYESAVPGAGDRFIAEVRRCLSFICEHP